MARIAEAVRPSTAQRAENERRAIADLEQEIQGLRTTQAAKLLDDDPGEAEKLADAITKAERRLSLRLDRFAALQKQHRRDSVDRLQQQKEAALVTFEQQVSNRVAAAARVDKAIAEFAASLIAYRAACRVPFQSWPATFPPLKLFEGASHGYIDSRIAAALHMRSSGSAHSLLTALPERLGQQEEQDVRLAASLVEDIRKAPLPGMHETEEAA